MKVYVAAAMYEYEAGATIVVFSQSQDAESWARDWVCTGDWLDRSDIVAVRSRQDGEQYLKLSHPGTERFVVVAAHEVRT